MEDAKDPHTEYLRKRRVWRYLNDIPGPSEPPTDGDEAWLKSQWAPVSQNQETEHEP